MGLVFGRTATRIAGPLILLAIVEFGFGVLFSVVGIGNPGQLDQLLTFVGFPLVFWIIVAGITEPILRKVLYTLAVGSSLVGTVIILYIGNQQGVLPQIIPTGLLREQAGADYISSTQGSGIQLYSLATLVAAAPIWVASLLVPHSKLLPPLWLRLLAASTCSAAALVAGRRAIVVTVIVAPVLVWLLSRGLGRPGADRLTVSRQERLTARRRRVGLIAAMVAGIVVVGNNAFENSIFSSKVVADSLGALRATFFGGTPSNIDDIIRTDESKILLRGWLQSPIFGHGFGATVPGYFRNSFKPWDFELQYHMLLFDTGLLGALFALAALVIVIVAARQAVLRRPEHAGTLVVTSVGTVSLLLAASSNPYFQAPGYYWSLFLSVAVVNVMLTGPGVSDKPAEIEPESRVDEAISPAEAQSQLHSMAVSSRDSLHRIPGSTPTG